MPPFGVLIHANGDDGALEFGDTDVFSASRGRVSNEGGVGLAGLLMLPSRLVTDPVEDTEFIDACEERRLGM
jgi:hypothetical protein